jgi:DNA-binding MarR family transcriptional regulator
MPLTVTHKMDTPPARMFAFFRLAKERIFSGNPQCPAFLDIAILEAASDGRDPSMKEIADLLRITGPSATAMIDRLVDKGELVRAEDPDDRRIVRLRTTAVGEKAFKAGRRAALTGMDGLLSVLGEGERAELDRIITKILGTP